MSTDSVRTAHALDARPALQTLAETVTVLAVVPVQFVSFWVATLLPLTYLPLLAAGVPESHPVGFVGVLVANAVAFVLGHGYDRPD